MQENPFWQVLWTLCGVATIVAAVGAHRGARWRLLGRWSVAVLFIVGGALLHVLNLLGGGDYSGFADPAHFAWVTDAWRAVVPPNQTLLIGLLAAFEATAGALALAGGRWTRLGYAAVVAFYLALWLFGWIETVWVLVMVPPTVVLLRAEREAAGTVAAWHHVSHRAAPRHS
jgi:hypothetical protein